MSEELVPSIYSHKWSDVEIQEVEVASDFIKIHSTENESSFTYKEVEIIVGEMGYDMVKRAHEMNAERVAEIERECQQSKMKAARQKAKYDSTQRSISAAVSLAQSINSTNVAALFGLK